MRLRDEVVGGKLGKEGRGDEKSVSGIILREWKTRVTVGHPLIPVIGLELPFLGLEEEMKKNKMVIR